mgnify:CR=1 FL=1
MKIVNYVLVFIAVTAIGMIYDRYSKKFYPDEELDKYNLVKNEFINYDMINKEKLDNLRLTVDYKEDFLLVEKIFEELYKDQKYFGLKDILKYVRKNSSLLDINKKYAIRDTGNS